MARVTNIGSSPAPQPPAPPAAKTASSADGAFGQLLQKTRKNKPAKPAASDSSSSPNAKPKNDKAAAAKNGAAPTSKGNRSRGAGKTHTPQPRPGTARKNGATTDSENDPSEESTEEKGASNDPGDSDDTSSSASSDDPNNPAAQDASSASVSPAAQAAAAQIMVHPRSARATDTVRKTPPANGAKTKSTTSSDAASAGAEPSHGQRSHVHNTSAVGDGAANGVMNGVGTAHHGASEVPSDSVEEQDASETGAVDGVSRRAVSASTKANEAASSAGSEASDDSSGTDATAAVAVAPGADDLQEGDGDSEGGAAARIGEAGAENATAAVSKIASQDTLGASQVQAFLGAKSSEVAQGGAGGAAGSTPEPSMSQEARFAAANHAQIISEVRGQLLPNGGTMQIRLDPPELGAMQVTIHMRDGALSATFQTTNDNATSLLSHSLSQLKGALEGQGVNVEKMQVQQAPRNPSGGSAGADEQSPNQRQQSEDDSARQEQQRRQVMQQLWRRLSQKGDPLDLVA